MTWTKTNVRQESSIKTRKTLNEIVSCKKINNVQGQKCTAQKTAVKHTWQSHNRDPTRTTACRVQLSYPHYNKWTHGEM